MFENAAIVLKEVGLDWIRLVRWFFDDQQAALFPKRMADRTQA